MTTMLSEFWSDLRYRVRAVFRRDDVERELDAEFEIPSSSSEIQNAMACPHAERADASTHSPSAA